MIPPLPKSDPRSAAVSTHTPMATAAAAALTAMPPFVMADSIRTFAVRQMSELNVTTGFISTLNVILHEILWIFVSYRDTGLTPICPGHYALVMRVFFNSTLEQQKAVTRALVTQGPVRMSMGAAPYFGNTHGIGSAVSLARISGESQSHSSSASTPVSPNDLLPLHDNAHVLYEPTNVIYHPEFPTSILHQHMSSQIAFYMTEGRQGAKAGLMNHVVLQQYGATSAGDWDRLVRIVASILSGIANHLVSRSVSRAYLRHRTVAYSRDLIIVLGSDPIFAHIFQALLDIGRLEPQIISARTRNKRNRIDSSASAATTATSPKTRNASNGGGGLLDAIFGGRLSKKLPAISSEDEDQTAHRRCSSPELNYQPDIPRDESRRLANRLGMVTVPLQSPISLKNQQPQSKSLQRNLSRHQPSSSTISNASVDTAQLPPVSLTAQIASMSLSTLQTTTRRSPNTSSIHLPDGGNGAGNFDHGGPSVAELDVTNEQQLDKAQAFLFGNSPVGRRSSFHELNPVKAKRSGDSNSSLSPLSRVARLFKSKPVISSSGGSNSGYHDNTPPSPAASISSTATAPTGLQHPDPRSHFRHSASIPNFHVYQHHQLLAGHSGHAPVHLQHQHQHQHQYQHQHQHYPHASQQPQPGAPHQQYGYPLQQFAHPPQQLGHAPVYSHNQQPIHPHYAATYNAPTNHMRSQLPHREFYHPHAHNGNGVVSVQHPSSLATFNVPGIPAVQKSVSTIQILPGKTPAVAITTVVAAATAAETATVTPAVVPAAKISTNATAADPDDISFGDSDAHNELSSVIVRSATPRVNGHRRQLSQPQRVEQSSHFISMQSSVLPEPSSMMLDLMLPRAGSVSAESSDPVDQSDEYRDLTSILNVPESMAEPTMPELPSLPPLLEIPSMELGLASEIDNTLLKLINDTSVPRTASTTATAATIDTAVTAVTTATSATAVNSPQSTVSANSSDNDEDDGNIVWKQEQAAMVRRVEALPRQPSSSVYSTLSFATTSFGPPSSPRSKAFNANLDELIKLTSTL